MYFRLGSPGNSTKCWRHSELNHGYVRSDLRFFFMRGGGGKGERRREYELISRETTGYWNYYSIPFPIRKRWSGGEGGGLTGVDGRDSSRVGGGEGSSNTIGKDCVTETGEHDSCSNCGFSCIHFYYLHPF